MDDRTMVTYVQDARVCCETESHPAPGSPSRCTPRAAGLCRWRRPVAVGGTVTLAHHATKMTCLRTYVYELQCRVSALCPQAEACETETLDGRTGTHSRSRLTCLSLERPDASGRALPTRLHRAPWRFGTHPRVGRPPPRAAHYTRSIVKLGDGQIASDSPRTPPAPPSHHAAPTSSGNSTVSGCDGDHGT